MTGLTEEERMAAEWAALSEGPGMFTGKRRNPVKVEGVIPSHDWRFNVFRLRRDELFPEWLRKASEQRVIVARLDRYLMRVDGFDVMTPDGVVRASEFDEIHIQPDCTLRVAKRDNGETLEDSRA